MITLITGAVGAGKSNALVEMLATIAVGRLVYVSGVPNLVIPHLDLADPANWHTECEPGSVIVIDEAQRIWRARRSATVPPGIVAMETSRHQGNDLFLVTQGPHLVDSNLRALVTRHIHIRKTGVGRWWYEWPECCANPSEKYKTAPISKTYRLSKKAQALYKSADIHTDQRVPMPPIVYVIAACVLGVGMLGWRAYGSVSGKLMVGEAAPPVAAASAPALAPGQTATTSGALFPPVAPAPDAVEAQPAEQGAAVAAAPHMLGCVAMGKRCECIGDDLKVMTVELNACEMNAKRGGAGIPYPYSVDAMARLVGGDQPAPPSSWYPQPQRPDRSTPSGGPSFTPQPVASPASGVVRT